MSSPEKIVILSFIDRKVYVLDYDSNIYHNVEDYFLSDEILETDLSINNCEFIVVPSEGFSINFSFDCYTETHESFDCSKR